MPPALNVDDYLFSLGGGTLLKTTRNGATTKWGIDPPTTAPTLALGTQLTSEIDDMNDNGAGDTPAARWTATTGMTDTTETTIKTEGNASLKLHVVKDTTASATASKVFDATVFSDLVTPSGDEDYISFRVALSHPSNIDSLQISFSLGDTNFSELYAAGLVPLSIKERIVGIGSDPRYAYDVLQSALNSRSKWSLDEFLKADLSSIGKQNVRGNLEILSNMAVDTLPDKANVWKHVYIPKKLFTYQGSGTYDWSDIKAVRITMITNGGGEMAAYIDDLKLLGGYGLQGNYSYAVTFQNSATGNRSNASPTVEIKGALRQPITLSDIPVSTDGQVDRREVWRTFGDGTLYFRCAVIEDNTTTTFTDTVADTSTLDTKEGAIFLEDEILPTDNTVPYSGFDDACYLAGTTFFLARDSMGAYAGRLYYSPPGRAESVRGYILVTNGDDPCQRVINFAGVVYVITKGGVFLIQGTEEPFKARRVAGCPGTSKPWTVSVGNYGVFYEATGGGICWFRGQSAEIIGYETVGRLFNGESVENLVSFMASDAVYAGNEEYFITDGYQTLVYNAQQKKWRDLGIGLDSLCYDPVTNTLVGTLNEKLCEIEKVGETQDNLSPISFDVQTHGTRMHETKNATLRVVQVDANPNGQTIQVVVNIDGVDNDLGGFTGSSRGVATLPLDKQGRVISTRLAASLTAPVEIFGVVYDIHMPITGFPSKEKGLLYGSDD
jgi:hypothetical protein